MGCCNRRRRSWHITIYIVIVSLFLEFFPSVRGSGIYNPESLNELLHDRATQLIAKNHTGTFLEVSLPANFSGIHASVVRLRSSSFWDRGANFSFVYIPPRVIPHPFVKRLALVYSNLGNWSNSYYEVAGYNLVTPVIGFMAYDASNLSKLGNETLKFSVLGEPISVRFPRVGLIQYDVGELKCVKFGEKGLVQFRNVTKGNICLTESGGHFSIAVPSPKENKNKNWRWWVLGFGAGLFGLVLLIVIGVTSYKLARRKRIGEMEEESEKSVALDTTWIGGRSKMPSASMIRTQPVLEQEYVP